MEKKENTAKEVLNELQEAERLNMDESAVTYGITMAGGVVTLFCC